MWFRRLTTCLATFVAVTLSASCATTKSVGDNIQHAYNHEPMDQKGLTQAIASDTRDMEANLAVLRRKFEAAYAQLKANVQKRWGQNDTKVANRTVYVKYTQGYKSRVITDFDHGTLTVETVDETDPQASLKATIAAALLTTSDPATVDLFSDKDVTLESNRRPYLYGLVHDNHGKSILTRDQAVQFANYNEALTDINGLPPAAIFDKLRTDLPSEETRQYVVKVTGYRKQFVNAPAEGTPVPVGAPATAPHAPATAVTQRETKS
jgi:Membrane-bound lytic murein transglycosylase C, N-terminal domain